LLSALNLSEKQLANDGFLLSALGREQERKNAEYDELVKLLNSLEEEQKENTRLGNGMNASERLRLKIFQDERLRKQADYHEELLRKRREHRLLKENDKKKNVGNALKDITNSTSTASSSSAKKRGRDDHDETMEEDNNNKENTAAYIDQRKA
jgi:hypothetical protein